ncbi:ABC transporter permease [Acrocarpospora pleiomorpha]|uniref:ABC transporter permease n=1 Tax=Acrocarpospora pleiomorpha TaxID=90975 RepID=A0A5M3XTQ3_9ACTN|nr:ABC transporter permease subunit [Acrocarpospora pleiomorpha]GES24256.1 ABC transporter permease [Acrocarpospora pleiomorpha]
MRRLRGLAPLVVLLAGWQLFGVDQSVYFSRPSTWWAALVAEWGSGDLPAAVWATTQTFVLSLAISTVLGALIGFAMAEVPGLDRSLNPTFEFLRVMPAAVTVPIFVLLLGYTDRMAIVAVVFASVWPMILSTRSAAADIPPLLRDVGATLHLSGYATMRKILFPAIFPAVFLALRVAGPITFIVTLLVEMLTGIPGAGTAIFYAQQSYRSATVYGLICVVAVVALIVDHLAQRLEGVATALGGSQARPRRPERAPI